MPLKEQGDTEVITIVKNRWNHPFYCRLESSYGRVLYGAQYCYFSGISEPNYPVPALRAS